MTPILAEAGEEEAARAFMATQNRKERQRWSVYTTGETMFAGFADPRVAAETAGADYTPGGCCRGRTRCTSSDPVLNRSDSVRCSPP